MLNRKDAELIKFILNEYALQVARNSTLLGDRAHDNAAQSEQRNLETTRLGMDIDRAIAHVYTAVEENESRLRKARLNRPVA